MTRTTTRTLIALALIASTGAAHAQNASANEPRDPYGRPLVGRNDFVRQPGDQPGPGGSMAAAPPAAADLSRDPASGAEALPARTGPRPTAFRDEYGFRYDAEGNRLDARGNIMSPHAPQR